MKYVSMIVYTSSPQKFTKSRKKINYRYHVKRCHLVIVIGRIRLTYIIAQRFSIDILNESRIRSISVKECKQDKDRLMLSLQVVLHRNVCVSLDYQLGRTI